MRGLSGQMIPERAIVAETRATIAVAGPLAAANLAQMAMGFTNTVIVGSLGSAALAAAGLGASLYFTVALVCSGILTAVAPLAGHAIGAGDDGRAGRVAGAGLVLAALLAVPVVAVLLVVGRLLVALGYQPALAAQIGHFLGAIAWAAPGFLGFAVLRSFLVAASHSRTVMIALVLCIPMNAGLNWILVFGHVGAPALGIAGSGCATAVIQWLMFIGLAFYTLTAPSLAGYLIRPSLRGSNEIGHIV